MNDESAQQQAARHQATGRLIIEAWHRELRLLGLAARVALPAWETATFALQRDPASVEDALTGSWRGIRGELRGSVVIHADGSFFAEYDILLPHPQRARWFIEAVTAWGGDAGVKAELRLLAMPE